jgi:hypothetical protein
LIPLFEWPFTYVGAKGVCGKCGMCGKLNALPREENSGALTVPRKGHARALGYATADGTSRTTRTSRKPDESRRLPGSLVPAAAYAGGAG